MAGAALSHGRPLFSLSSNDDFAFALSFHAQASGLFTKGLPMTDTKEERAFNNEIPDEVLECAGANEIAGQYTLAACTGLSVCPG